MSILNTDNFHKRTRECTNAALICNIEIRKLEKEHKHYKKELETATNEDIFAMFDHFQLCNQTLREDKLPRSVGQLVLDILCRLAPLWLHNRMLLRNYTIATNMQCPKCNKRVILEYTDIATTVCSCGAELTVCDECGRATDMINICNHRESYPKNKTCLKRACNACIKRAMPASARMFSITSHTQFMTYDTCMVPVYVNESTGEKHIEVCAGCMAKINDWFNTENK
jgi:hypothetical protein